MVDLENDFSMAQNQYQYILHAKILSPFQTIEDGYIAMQNGIIEALGEMVSFEAPENASCLDAGGLLTVPAYIDAHSHGGAGFDYLNCTEEELRRLLHWLPSTGVTGVLATLSSEALAAQKQAIEKLVPFVGDRSEGAALLGIHLEGPYYNMNRLGAQLPGVIRNPDSQEIEVLLEAGRGAIRLVTLAPELPGALEAIHLLSSRGVTVSCGHSEASYEQVLEAVEAGVSRATHTFNSMPPLDHRAPGIVGAVLTSDTVCCELIMDGIHVHPAVARLVMKVKGAARTTLVTDSTQAAGQPDGIYFRPGNRKIIVKDGASRLETGSLAGSVLTMDRAVANAVRLAGVPLAQAVQMAGLSAATSLNLAQHKGSIESGKDADIVFLNDDLSVQMTMSAGRIVYRAGQEDL